MKKILLILIPVLSALWLSTSFADWTPKIPEIPKPTTPSIPSCPPGQAKQAHCVYNDGSEASFYCNAGVFYNGTPSGNVGACCDMTPLKAGSTRSPVCTAIP